MAQYFDLKFLFTPTITYSKDLEMGVGKYVVDLEYVPLNFSDNHISYIREEEVNEILKYDPKGVKLAMKYADTKKVHLV